jgi:hypothetical protein
LHYRVGSMLSGDPVVRVRTPCNGGTDPINHAIGKPGGILADSIAAAASGDYRIDHRDFRTNHNPFACATAESNADGHIYGRDRPLS